MEHGLRKDKVSGWRFFTTNMFLVLMGVGLLAASVYLWKTQETRNLKQIFASTEAKARLYSSETEVSYNNIYTRLERLAKKSYPETETSIADWNEDAGFYISAFKGLKSLALVDKVFRIQLIQPVDGNLSYQGQLANEVEWDPLDVNLWVPIYDGIEFRGYLLGTVNIAELLATVIDDIGSDYMLSISREGKVIYASENWQEPRQDYLVEKVLTLVNTTVLNISFAPTDQFIISGIADARNTLYFSLLFSMITLLALFFAQKFRSLSALNEMRYRKTLESMLEGCLIISPEWRFLFVNDTAAAQNQHKREEMIGKTMMEFDPEIEKNSLFPLLQTCMKEHISQKTLILSKDPNGEEHWYQLSIQPAPDGIFILSEDVSEQKKAEKEIHTLNAELERRVQERTTQLEFTNKELEAFSYSVSHDLRAPLRGIDGWSLALMEDYGSQLDGKAKTYLERVRSETQRMGLLIDDLLQLSRLTRSEMTIKKVNLSAMAGMILAQLQETQPDRQVEFIIQPNLNANGDARLLEIALTNLFDNALKFTSKTPQACIQFGQTKMDGQPAFFVRDNGAGFDMTSAKKIFGAFQRMHKASDFPGTGIGLTTIQRIVHRHGGRIWAEAAVDQGATFYFTLEENP